jgi:hypothetical protein
LKREFELFDTISHEFLLLKLKRYGLSDKAIKPLKSYLTNRRQAVIRGKKVSKFEDIEISVFQGNSLGPLLFIIYINDIFKTIVSGKMLIFADDITTAFRHKNFGKLE